MRDCGADCENRIVVGRHRRAVLGGPGAMKERLPSLQLAANDLRQACWQHAVVCLLAGMKETPNHRVRLLAEIRAGSLTRAGRIIALKTATVKLVGLSKA